MTVRSAEFPDHVTRESRSEICPGLCFWIAGIWGVLVITPLYFMFDLIGRNDPPPITHPGTDLPERRWPGKSHFS